ncbi:cytochrome P450 monooxygenase-like protein [Stemphylium lycopersici]|nr:cytochrome P450 monooxygenase-like protein [Stemphylium lycopersici]
MAPINENEMEDLRDLTRESSLADVLVVGIKTFLVCYVFYSLAAALSNIAFGPLSRYPGPKLRGAFHFPNVWDMIKGNVPQEWHALHEKYGEVVRISPDTISFINPEAWRAATGANHARIRRPLNHAFSEQALRSQETIINSYITLLVKKLQRRASRQIPADLMQYLNFATFDITGDLAFDESFDALENEVYNSWISNLFKSLWFANMLMIIKTYPIVGKPVTALLDSVPSLAEAETKHNNFTEEKTARRLASNTERKDFLSYILKNKGKVTDLELQKTSGTLIFAGSETTATLLSGIFYYLMRNPRWMTKLNEELHATFTSESDITFASLSSLKVLNAIIQETFRLYPPVPTALPRLIPKGGATIWGHWLPGGTRVGIPQYAQNRSSHHFTHPELFAPERFLGAKEFESDKRHVIQPFSVGPRNCIGQSLAWAETRTILARLVWNFEFELLDTETRWEDQRVFLLWEKSSLLVRLKGREGVA